MNPLLYPTTPDGLWPVLENRLRVSLTKIYTDFGYAGLPVNTVVNNYGLDLREIDRLEALGLIELSDVRCASSGRVYELLQLTSKTARAVAYDRTPPCDRDEAVPKIRYGRARNPLSASEGVQA